MKDHTPSADARRVRCEIVNAEKDDNTDYVRVLVERDGSFATLTVSYGSWTADSPDPFKTAYFREFGETPDLDWRDWLWLRDHCETLLGSTSAFLPDVSLETTPGVDQ
jgi:hypothetical protein